MKFELEPYNRGLPDEAFLQDLRRVAEELGKCVLTREDYSTRGRFHPVGSKEYAAHGCFSDRHFIRHFGSWSDALLAAGLSVSPQFFQRNSDEDYFKNLENVWRSLGRQPKSTEMYPPLSQLSASAYKHRFGSWRKALEAFVVIVNGNVPLQNSESAVQEKSSDDVGDEELHTSHKTSRSVSWRLRFLVMRRDDFKCRLCGAAPAMHPGVVLQVDHILPWSKGGETVLENLQTLCLVCNNGKSDLRLNR
jgi:hypothetical protein